jgi:hypothetical protein
VAGDTALRNHLPVATGSVEALAAEGREALARADPAASRRAFEAALAERESGELFEGLARALYLAVDYPGSIEAHERAFVAYKEQGDGLGAARAARVLSWLHGNVYGDWAVAGGWLVRAARLLEGAGEDSAEHGWIEVMRAFNERPAPAGSSRCAWRSSSAGGSATRTSSSWRWAGPAIRSS